MLNVDIAQVREYLPVLIEQTIAGNDVFITQSGLPIIRLVPVAEVKKQRRFGSAKGLFSGLSQGVRNSAKKQKTS